MKGLGNLPFFSSVIESPNNSEFTQVRYLQVTTTMSTIVNLVSTLWNPSNESDRPDWKGGQTPLPYRQLKTLPYIHPQEP